MDQVELGVELATGLHPGKESVRPMQALLLDLIPLLLTRLSQAP